jgi:cellulose synthase/poly-beta-1,6-N-acetylglucosamine synthase-like glycosyltransferase
LPWPSIISFVVLVLTGIYCALLLLVLWGLFRVREGRNQRLDTVSVVVAAKNESGSIGACLEALLSQDYPSEGYEIVVVDDGSTDATAEIVKGFAQENPNLKLLNAHNGDNHLRAKKRALQRGIENSHGDIILITDADCLPTSTWIRAMIRHFEPDVGLVVGQVRHAGSSFWQRLCALERLSVAAVAAGAIGLGRGLTAIGSNLGYRRRVFQDVNGFKNLSAPLSGDDDLFVQLVSRKTRWRLRYAFGPQAAVTTELPANLSQFVAQQRRRASKGQYYPLWLQAILAEVWLMNLALAVTLPFSLGHPTAYFLPLIAFAGKALGESLILIKVSQLFKTRGLLRFFPLAAILHIPYFLVFSIWGTLGGYRWKGLPNKGLVGQWVDKCFTGK